jgi:hypothetical protein
MVELAVRSNSFGFATAIDSCAANSAVLAIDSCSTPNSLRSLEFPFVLQVLWFLALVLVERVLYCDALRYHCKKLVIATLSVRSFFGSKDFNERI